MILVNCSFIIVVFCHHHLRFECFLSHAICNGLWNILWNTLYNYGFSSISPIIPGFRSTIYYLIANMHDEL